MEAVKLYVGYTKPVQMLARMIMGQLDELGNRCGHCLIECDFVHLQPFQTDDPTPLSGKRRLLIVPLGASDDREQWTGLVDLFSSVIYYTEGEARFDQLPVNAAQCRSDRELAAAVRSWLEQQQLAAIA